MWANCFVSNARLKLLVHQIRVNGISSVEAFIMSGRTLSDFVHNLETYCAIARELEKGAASLRDIARRLDISSVSIISSCIQQMEREYGGKTLVSRTSTSGHNTLTNEGQELLRTGEKILDQLQDVRNGQSQATLRVAASHFLLVYVLPDLVRTYINSTSVVVKNIEFQDAYDFEGTIDQIINGILDFAIVWNLAGRQEQAHNQPYLHYEVFNNRFDVVAICRPDHPFARKDAVDIEEFAEHRVFVLHGQHQPFRELIPMPNKARGGSRTELKDYTTIIANIRMGINGVALVPGVYKDLDYYQKLGTLVYVPVFYKNESGEKQALHMDVAGVFKVKEKNSTQYTMSHDAYKFYEMVMQYYNNPENKPEPGWRTKAREAALLPRSLDLSEYGQAHFMVLTSEGVVKVPEWRRARIDWKGTRTKTEREGTLTIIGSVENTALSESYNVSAGALADHVYYLKAEARDKTAHKPPIITTFHMSLKTVTKAGEGQAIYGFWHGATIDNKPMMGPFILVRRAPDDDEIAHPAIADVARFGMLRVSTNHVDRPPKS
jgi:DNA-binding transcriptional LysR family regulator